MSVRVVDDASADPAPCPAPDAGEFASIDQDWLGT